MNSRSWGWKMEEGRTYHVVAVDMHGVHRDIEIIDNNADTSVAAEVVDVPVAVVWIGVVFLGGEEEEGVVVVGTKGLIIEKENVVAGSIGFEVEREDLGRGGDESGRKRVEGCR